MQRTELMQLLWNGAEEAQRNGDARTAYLLTFAGNLVEATFTTNPINEAVEHAENNADNIVFQDSLFIK
jgi:hypothetical protein